MSVAATRERAKHSWRQPLTLAEGVSPAAASRSRSYWLTLLASLIAVRGVWFLLDSTPMLFLGDSESYIHSALTGWIPPDRSFVYGLVVRLVAVWPGSLRGLLAWQAACSVVAGLLLAAAILETVGDHPLLAGLLAVAWAGLEPLALLWERYVMAEASALPLFGAFVLCGLRYIRTRRLRWLLFAELAAIGVVAFRLPFVGVAWLGGIVLPVLALIVRAPRRQLCEHLLLSIVFTASLHTGYRALYGKLSDGPVGYQHAEGAFLLAAWAPLLQPEDFPDPILGRRVMEGSTCALRDRWSREGQRWAVGCLVSQLEKTVGDPGTANEIARRTALRVAIRDPLGVAHLALDTWLDYFDRSYLALAMRWDRRETDYGARVNQMLASAFHLDGSGLPHLSTATNRLYFAARPWLVILSASPFLAWLACAAQIRSRGGDWARQGAWIAAITSTIMAMTALTAVSALPRYLQPVGWLAPIWIAELLRAVPLPPSPGARSIDRRTPISGRRSGTDAT